MNAVRTPCRKTANMPLFTVAMVGRYKVVISMELQGFEGKAQKPFQLPVPYETEFTVTGALR
jgi:hypothetical protein